MPLRPAAPVPALALARCFHAARQLRHDGGAARSHYERLRVRHDASPADIKKCVCLRRLPPPANAC